MMVVTGTQRSGTSLIAKALDESGYDLGTEWWDEEVQGGYEHKTICAFYREYLGDPTFPFDDMELPRYCEGAVEELFLALDFEVVKFCYLLMNPAFVAIWHKFRPKGDTFLVMSRDTQDVVSSKMRLPKRFSHDSPLLWQAPSTLRGNFIRSFSLLLHLGYRVATLHFPKCLDDLRDINNALAALDPNVQINSYVWERVLDEDLIHFGKGESK